MICKIVEAVKKIHPELKYSHQIRESVIMNWLKTNNIRQVQYMAGHKSIRSTESYLGHFWNKLGFGKRGYYSAYLVIDEGVDYHWYRQDKGGLWSHKPGITPVLNADASRHLITNPAGANIIIRVSIIIMEEYFYG